MTKTEMYDIDETLSKFGFGKSDIAKVKNGQVVNVHEETLTERDLATKVAFEARHTGNLNHFEKAFLESPRKMESDDTIQQMVVDKNRDGCLDFSSVKLLPDDSAAETMKTYLTFQGGEALNLSENEIEMFQALDSKNATREQVEEVLAKVLQGRLDEYQQRGLEGIAPYRRSKKGKNFYPGKELLEKTEKSKFLHKFSEEFNDYILSLPNRDDKRAKETYGWINYKIDDRPSIALYHRVIWSEDDENGEEQKNGRGRKFLMNRTFYVSIGHNSVQQFGFAVPTENNKILLGFTSRTSTDKVTGFGGSAKRAIGSRIMGGRIVENMEALRELSQAAAFPDIRNV